MKRTLGFLLFAFLSTFLAKDSFSAVSVNVVLPDGSVASRALKDHPRVWVDGSSGTINGLLKDPDGSGPGQSALYDHEAAFAMREVVRLYRGNYNLEGHGELAIAVAVSCYMDNTGVIPNSGGITYCQEWDNMLSRAKYTFFFGCMFGLKACGTVASDFAGEDYLMWAQAYSLMRGRMTPQQRTDYANLMFNGVDGLTPCNERLKRRPGRISSSPTPGSSSNKFTISGASWDPSIAVGRAFLFQSEANLAVRAGYNYQYVTAFDGTTVTASGNGTFNGNGVYATLDPEDEDTCGLGRLMLSHGNVPSYLVYPSVIQAQTAVMTSSISVLSPSLPTSTTGYVQTIQISPPNWSPLAPDGSPAQFPFKVAIDNTDSGEIVYVLGISGSTATISRGHFMGTSGYAANRTLIFQVQSKSDPNTAQIGYDNRNLTRAQSALAMAIALADDDSRAAALVERATRYFYTNVYLPVKLHWTINNSSAVEYGMGRTAPHLTSHVMSLYNSFETPVDYTSGDWIKNYISLFNIYWSTPWDNKRFKMWGVPAGNSCATPPTFLVTTPSCFDGPLAMNIMFPSVAETTYMNYQFDVRNSLYADVLTQGKLQGTTGFGAGITTLRYLLTTAEHGSWARQDYRSIISPSRIWQTGDSGTVGGTGLASFVSAGGWSTSTVKMWGLFLNGFSDKMNGSGPHSTYAIGKNGFLIDDNQVSQEGAYDVGYQTNVDYGYAFKAGVRINKEDLVQALKGKDGDSNYFYASVDALKQNDNNGSFHHVTRQHRQFMHFYGEPEVIFAFDDLAKTGAERMRSFIQYPNNGRTALDGALEGITSLDSSSATFVTSTNSSTTTAKIITQLMYNGGTVPKVYDLGATAPPGLTGGVGNPITIGIDCKTEAPCRVRTGSTIYSYSWTTAPTITGYTSLGSGAFIFVYIDNAGVLTAGRNSQVGTYTLNGGIADAGVISDFPGDAIDRIAKVPLEAASNQIEDYGAGGPCPGVAGINSSTAAREWGSCVGPNNRVVFMDNGTTGTTAEFQAVHRVTSNLSEQPVAASSMTTITSNFRGIYWPGPAGSTSPVHAIFPKSQGTYSSLTFTASHSGTARFGIAGLLPGNYTRTRNGGSSTSVDVGTDGTTFFTGASGDYVFTFNSALPLNIETVSLSDMLVNQAQTIALSIVGGIPTYTVTIASGSLPTGLVMNSSGVISGTPTVVQTSTFTVKVQDSVGSTDYQAYTINVIPSASLSIVQSSLAGAQVGVAYEVQLSGFGGTSPYTWTLNAGSFPSGISISTGGLISGTPAALSTGTYTPTIRVTDSAGSPAHADRQYSLVVSSVSASSVAVVTTTLPHGTLGDEYGPGGVDLEAGGGTAPYTWTALTSLPLGLSLSGSGNISGIVGGTTGNKCFDVTAADSQGIVSSTATLCIEVFANANKFVVTPVGLSALVEFTLTGLPASSTCTYTLANSLGAQVDSGVVAAGHASRSFIATAVSTGSHTGVVQCTASNFEKTFSVFMTSATGSGTFTRNVVPPSGRSITHARLLYGSVGGSLTGTTPVACSSGCELTFTAARGTYDVQHQYCLDSGCSTTAGTSRRRKVSLR